MSVSDEDLRLYLEGTIAPDVAAQIEAALAEDPALEDRLMALDPMAGIVREAVAQMPAPNAAQVEEWVAPQAKAAARWPALVAGLVIGALAMGSLALATRPEAPGWRAAVASYQALYSAETVASLQFSESALRDQLTQAEARIGAEGLYELVSGLDELQLLRTQLLAHNGAPLVQIVFATESGVPVALCLMQNTSGQSAGGAPVTTLEGLASLAFDSTDHSWLLIGTQDAELIATAGATLKSRLAIDA